MNELQSKLISENPPPNAPVVDPSQLVSADPGTVVPSATPSLRDQFAASGLSFNPNAPVVPNLPSRDAANQSLATPAADAFPDTPAVQALRAQQQPPAAPPATVPFRQVVAGEGKPPHPAPVAHGGGGTGAPAKSYTQMEIERQLAEPTFDSGKGEAAWQTATEYGDAARRHAAEQRGNLSAREAEVGGRAREREAIEKEDAKATEHEYFKSENGFQHAADVVGAIAGGALMGYRGLGSNPYLDQQDRRINRFIASQRAAHEDKAKGAANAYSAALDKWKDHDAATAAVHADVLDAIAAKAAERAASTTDAEEAHNAELGKDALRMQAAQYRDRALQAAQARAAAQNDPKRVLELQKMLDEHKAAEANVAHTEEETAASKQKRDGADAGAAGTPAPKSTNWDPTRNIQGTEAFSDKLQAQQYNAQIMGTAHKQFGARTPEAQQEIMKGYIINPGDSQDTIDAKTAAYKRDFPKKSLRQATADDPSADDLGLKEPE